MGKKMNKMLKSILAGTALVALTSGAALAQGAAFSDGKIKIGVLNDRSGIYADVAGEGSAEIGRASCRERV